MNGGNGYFGKWIEGLSGSAAYLYEINQINDTKALTMTNKAWNDRRNHSFCFGNDRIVALCSNFGYIQLRHDERCPKFLNDYNPEKLQYGGGFGYLKGKKLLRTYYDGQEMRREYGAGYMRKITKNDEAEVEEIMFAPYGDDPVMLKKVVIKNITDKPVEFEWYDYMAAHNYQFTFTHYCSAQLTFNTANVSRCRRRLEKDYTKTILKNEYGFNLSRKYKPSLSLARIGQSAAEGLFRKFSARFFAVKNNSGVDREPYDNAYYCLNDTVSTLTDAPSFFGSGGVNFPDYFKNGNTKCGKSVDMFLLKNCFTLKPNEEKTLTFAFVYSRENSALAKLIKDYKSKNIDDLLNHTIQKWKTDRISITISGEEWIDREFMWHNAYLRGSMTYSDYFEAHILSQGGHYQYLMGLQGAPRDQLQHALPFIYSEPYIAREHILFSLREMSDKGELPYATHGYGMMFAAVMVPSDLQLMLLNFVAEYVLATRDYAFLDTKYTSKKDGGKTERTVLEGVMLAYKYIQEEIGKGEHGLVRMRTGDWNDQAVYGRVPITKTKYAQKHSESMLNSAIAIYSFRIFGEMLKAIGKVDEAVNSIQWSDDIKAAVAKQWNGKWFKRAFMGEKLGWLGDDLLWLEPQPWALIGEALSGDDAQTLADNIRTMLNNPNGASLISYDKDKTENSKGLDVGTLENGGIWPAINGYLVWALSKINGKYAYEEWLKNSRYAQAEAYPEIWYGIWSGPDSVNASYAKYPGRTQNSKNPYTGKREKLFKLTVGMDWEDFPVLNLHAHTWQQYTIFKLLGVEFTADELIIAPTIPKDSYEVASRLLCVKRDGQRFDIQYKPLSANKLKLIFCYKDKPSTVVCNGKAIEFDSHSDKTIIELPADKLISISITYSDNKVTD
ncbi:MAG: hypothetical protein EOM87_00290 [Clostridia bacterium]|nr:hypothetical protein [Clostridia bacterium]